MTQSRFQHTQNNDRCQVKGCRKQPCHDHYFASRIIHNEHCRCSKQTGLFTDCLLSSNELSASDRLRRTLVTYLFSFSSKCIPGISRAKLSPNITGSKARLTKDTDTLEPSDSWLVFSVNRSRALPQRPSAATKRPGSTISYFSNTVVDITKSNNL